MANFGRNLFFFAILAASVSLWLGMQKLACIIVAMPACVRFCLECAHAKTSRHACHCAKVLLSLLQRSIECLLGTDEDAKVPEGTMGKEHGRGRPNVSRSHWIQ